MTVKRGNVRPASSVSSCSRVSRLPAPRCNRIVIRDRIKRGERSRTQIPSPLPARGRWHGHCFVVLRDAVVAEHFGGGFFEMFRRRGSVKGYLKGISSRGGGRGGSYTVDT